jgi:hypothetical protein
MIWIKIALLKNKELAGFRPCRGRKGGGGPPKFGGMSHDVAENKGRKKFIPRKSPMFMKIKELSVSATMLL